MKKTRTGQSTRMALPSATSTWRTAAKHERAPVQISPVHLEKEQQLENALDEYCLLRTQDGTLTASRFCDRYPSYRQSLRRLIDVHEAMEGQPELDEEPWPELFTEFLGYEILHELGVGAIARVYLATEAALGGRLVAIKVAREGGYEAETLGKLAHPNIVPVFSVKHDEQTDLTAVCMPYHGSATLADLLEIGFQHGTPPTSARTILEAAREREQIVDFVESVNESRPVDSVLARGDYVDGIARLGIQMAEALAYTHERGILHRDLKPSNVLLTPDGAAMLLDFNLASGIEAGAQRLGGTLPYMPPEQIRDVHLHPFEADLEGDPRSDIFSLGVILYELLTGKLPFGDPPACVAPRQAAEEFLAAQQRNPPSVHDLNPAVSCELAQLVHKCLALEASQRPASAAELVSELKKYFATSRRVRRWTARHRGAVTSIVLMLTLTTVASTWHLATRPPYVVRQYNAALADMKREKHHKAIEHLDRVIKENKVYEDSVPFRYARGLAYHRLGDFKLAEIDLAAAAELANDPVVFECCAYAQMRMKVTTASPRVSARYMYSQMAELGELTPENELNWAFANFDMRPVPAVVISRCSAALEKRPDWQNAYYLRALAHVVIAKQALQRNSGDQNKTQLTNSIKSALSDFDKAISIGPSSARLLTDAAEARAIHDGNQPSATLRELLELAARYGAPQRRIDDIGKYSDWSKDAWFRNVVSSCSGNPELFLEPDYAERFLTAPNDVLVDERLAAYLKQLSQAP